MQNTWIELSQKLTNSTPVYPADPQVILEEVCQVATASCAVTALNLGSHSGTHVDAPAHFYDSGTALAEFTPSRFITSALLIDLQNLAPNTKISAEALINLPSQNRLTAVAQNLKSSLALSTHFQAADTILAVTGWDKHLNDKTYFEHPFFTADFAHALLAKGYKTFGCDTISPDPLSGNYEFHKTFLAHNDSLIVENLCNLTQLLKAAQAVVSPNTTQTATADIMPSCKFIFLPLLTDAKDAAPARALGKA